MTTAVNLTTIPVELDPVNGAGALAAAVEGSEGAHERELAEVTDRERALAAAGTIALVDSAGRRRPPRPPAPGAEPATDSGGEG